MLLVEFLSIISLLERVDHTGGDQCQIPWRSKGLLPQREVNPQATGLELFVYKTPLIL